jgi:hypothetical protein
MESMVGFEKGEGGLFTFANLSDLIGDFEGL